MLRYTSLAILFTLCVSASPDTSPRPRPVQPTVCRVIAEIGTPHSSFRASDFPAGAKFFATGGSEGKIFLWSPGRRKPAKEFDLGRGRIYALGISPDAKYAVASTRKPRNVVIYNLRARDAEEEINVMNVRRVAVAPKGGRFAIVDSYIRTKIYDFDGEELADINDGMFRPYTLQWSTNGKMLAMGGLDRSVKIWDVDNDEELHTLQGHTQYAAAMAFSLDDKLLVTGGRDKEARLWDVQSGDELAVLKGHKGPLTAVCFSPDRRYVLTGDSRGLVYVWSVASGKLVRKIDDVHLGSVQAIYFSPDRRWLITIDSGGTIRVWGGTGGDRKK